MLRVLITGGAGYIGSVLTRDMLNYFSYGGSDRPSCFDVTVLDNMMYDRTSLLECLNKGNFKFVNGDVRDKDLLKSLIKENDVIISLAALVGAGLCDKKPIEAQQINYEVNKFIAENKSKDQYLIYPNTNSGYGTTDGTSIITEKDPLNPISIYGKTKCEAEKVIQQVENHVTFRLATVFGVSPRMRTDLLVNNLVYKAMKDKVLIVYEGQYMRNYIHVNDVSHAFIHTIKKWDICKNQTFNVGNDQINMSKLDLCKEIAKQLPVEIIQSEFTKDPDKRNYIVSSQKFYDTKFDCYQGLDVGISRLITAYKMIDEPWKANY